MTITYLGHRKDLKIGARYAFTKDGQRFSGRVADKAYDCDSTEVTFKNINTY